MGGGSSLPEEGAYRGPTDGIVLLEPVGTSDSYPLDVTGYARTFEGHVAAKLLRGDTVLADTFTTAGGGIETWGEFRMRFESGPRGALRLFVSGEDQEESPRARGLEVPLTLAP